ncbi:type II secretion system minor pseudopilin GspK [Sphingomicrobium nitratireducens]|uniref:type II secretion system minor pseudopilin GspK n=1 Tax=Sphingomicrobium nitratireducens TaxID=2964666 RepID=UPI00223FB72F|nr:type II secretion system minor pseudopilin GspK [Sphingomicrobium nitratireducens]
MIPHREKGTALLSVLLLVAVMAVVAATALDRLGLATRLARNASIAAQSRLWLQTGEQIALTRLADANGADGAAVAAQLGVERSVTLPDGQVALLQLDDATNCFNLNSLAREREDGTLTAYPRAIRQLRELLLLLGISEADAIGLSTRAVDAIDSDSAARPAGSEIGQDGKPLPNRAFVSASEFTLIEGVDASLWQRLSPYLCALPRHELSRINLETITLDKAELVAMLDPDGLALSDVRAAIAARPRSGFGDVDRFLERPAFADAVVPSTVRGQLSTDTDFVSLRTRITLDGLTLAQRSLIERSDSGPRLRGRLWGADF